MPVCVLVETTDNNRGRFVSESIDAALVELSRLYPIGASVAERLRRGERVVTDAYTLAICSLATVPEKKQRVLF